MTRESYGRQKINLNIQVKKNEKSWNSKTLYGKHLLDFLKYLYSNLMFSLWIKVIHFSCWVSSLAKWGNPPFCWYYQSFLPPFISFFLFTFYSQFFWSYSATKMHWWIPLWKTKMPTYMFLNKFKKIFVVLALLKCYNFYAKSAFLLSTTKSNLTFLLLFKVHFVTTAK